MDYPSDLELLEFFETEPDIEADIRTYNARDPSGATLAFSFNVYDDSVQTRLKQDERTVLVASHECLSRMWIEDGMLHAECESAEYRITLTIALRPLVRVEWSGLRAR